MKISKIALYFVLVPVVIIIIASGLFIATFDANDYKQDLIDYVKDNSGRTLDFNGEAELMLYPDFGMRLGAMTFSNATGFGETPMVAVKEVSVSVDVKSILMLQPKISQLILTDLQVDLQKNKQGITNWDDLLPENTKKEGDKTPNKKQEKDGFNIQGAFEGMNIRNAKVSWKDASTGDAVSLDDLDFVTGKITPSDPFPLSLHLEMHKKKDINVVMDLETNVFFDLASNQLDIRNLEIKLNAHGDLIPVDVSDISMSAGVNFDLNKKLLKVSQLALQLKTEGGVMEKTDVKIATELSMNLKKQHLILSQLAIEADIKDASMPKGNLHSAIKSKQISISLEQRKVDIPQLKIDVNEIQLNGVVNVKDYAQPALSFNLNAQKIDLDEMLGLDEKNEEDKKISSEPQEQKDVEIVLPIELMRSLDIDGQLNVAQLKAMNVATSNNKINIKAQKGLVEIKPLSLNLYDGALNSQITIDVRKDKPKFKIKSNLDKVQIGDLLIDFMQLDKIRGAATVAIDVETNGSWVSELKQSSNGSVSLVFADGALKGFNLRHLIDVAKAKFSRSKEPSESVQETDFTELKLSGILKKGVFFSDDLSLKSPLIRVGGEGKADLNKSTVDYTVNAKIISSLEGQTGEGLDAKGLLIPVRIFGPFSSPKTDILIDNLLKQKAKKKLEEAKAVLDAKKEKAKADIRIQQEKAKAELEEKKREEKAALDLKAKQLKAENKAKLDAKKKKKEAEAKAKKKAAEEKAKKRIDDKLKSFLK